jgi:hypothetical protein
LAASFNRSTVVSLALRVGMELHDLLVAGIRTERWSLTNSGPSSARSKRSSSATKSTPRVISSFATGLIDAWAEGGGFDFQMAHFGQHRGPRVSEYPQSQ